ncbi:hypothetical protein C5C36_15575 [Rathayibacter sp. AY1G1]|jgi:ABC-type spermidine/putrescine transport system permease subunit II|uniref:hypothetical protein n=1 Tax=unclassified Rathayibacter TaxID=2609250 RepID=UPI000CE841C9|nr:MULTISPECIES: hypothetical protein [unclassified Rathayibacter]PPF09944.1 hypothetical protein C5B98_13790 [Rathayibacter sp. AY1A5]PPF13685.1 hypothetical protein C5B92_16265 [Rathayibacter sp. AY1A4]PPF25828.1 hypothetical protein C5C54_14355 [Rathayibacter sp. AY1F2]PPF33124.1 hypothetical protein C5B93_14565 [Rathayibacter sp. AY1A2]PPF46338.1 hypothetical protein C5E14_11455 [Rathayibacter sp. AY1A1]
MFWIGVAGILLGIVFGTIVPFWIAPYQANGSPTVEQIISTIPVLTRIAEGIGYSFVAGAFVVRHFEKRELVDARRSVHFVGRAARKDEQ